MSSSTFSKLLESHQACLAACEELRQCFEEERRLAVEFKSDLILENNNRKENSIQELSALRSRYRTLRDSLALSTEEQHALRKAEAQWLDSWGKLRIACEINGGFLRHSLKNLEMMSDHLKRLLGILSTYTQSGAKVDTRNEGTVLQGSY